MAKTPFKLKSGNSPLYQDLRKVKLEKVYKSPPSDEGPTTEGIMDQKNRQWFRKYDDQLQLGWAGDFWDEVSPEITDLKTEGTRSLWMDAPTRPASKKEEREFAKRRHLKTLKEIFTPRKKGEKTRIIKGVEKEWRGGRWQTKK